MSAADDQRKYLQERLTKGEISQGEYSARIASLPLPSAPSVAEQQAVFLREQLEKNEIGELEFSARLGSLPLSPKPSLQTPYQGVMSVGQRVPLSTNITVVRSSVDELVQQREAENVVAAYNAGLINAETARRAAPTPALALEIDRVETARRRAEKEAQRKEGAVDLYNKGLVNYQTINKIVPELSEQVREVERSRSVSLWGPDDFAQSKYGHVISIPKDKGAKLPELYSKYYKADTSTWTPEKYEQKFGVDFSRYVASQPLTDQDLKRIAAGKNVLYADLYRLGGIAKGEAINLAQDVLAGRKTLPQTKQAQANYGADLDSFFEDMYSSMMKYNLTEHHQLPKAPRPYENLSVDVPAAPIHIQLEQEGKIIGGLPSAEFLYNYYDIKPGSSIAQRDTTTPDYYTLVDRFAKEQGVDYWRKKTVGSIGKVAPIQKTVIIDPMWRKPGGKDPLSEIAASSTMPLVPIEPTAEYLMKYYGVRSTLNNPVHIDELKKRWAQEPEEDKASYARMHTKPFEAPAYKEEEVAKSAPEALGISVAPELLGFGGSIGRGISAPYQPPVYEGFPWKEKTEKTYIESALSTRNQVAAAVGFDLEKAAAEENQKTAEYNAKAEQYNRQQQANLEYQRMLQREWSLEGMFRETAGSALVGGISGSFIPGLGTVAGAGSFGLGGAAAYNLRALVENVWPERSPIHYDLPEMKTYSPGISEGYGVAKFVGELPVKLTGREEKWFDVPRLRIPLTDLETGGEMRTSSIYSTAAFLLGGAAYGKIATGNSIVRPRATASLGAEEEALWKGLSLELSPTRAYPLIGKAGGRWQLGTPKLEIDLAKIKPGYYPASSTETKIVLENVMPKLPAKEAAKIRTMRDVMGVTQKQPSKFIQDKFIEETKTLSPRGVREVLKFSKAEKATVYGSVSAEAQMPRAAEAEALGISTRVPADIDLQLRGNPEMTAKKVAELAARLRKIGEPVEVSKQSPTLIESYRGVPPGGAPRHAVDAHFSSIGEKGIPQAGGFGFRFGQRPIKIEKTDTMPLSEQGLRKGSSAISLGPEQVGPMEPVPGKNIPGSHRFKDIEDAINTQKVLIESMKRTRLAPLRQGKIARAERSLAEYSRLVKEDPLVSAESPGLGRVRAELYSPESYKVRASPAAAASWAAGVSSKDLWTEDPYKSPSLTRGSLAKVPRFPSTSRSVPPSRSAGLGSTSMPPYAADLPSEYVGPQVYKDIMRSPGRSASSQTTSRSLIGPSSTTERAFASMSRELAREFRSPSIPRSPSRQASKPISPASAARASVPSASRSIETELLSSPYPRLNPPKELTSPSLRVPSPSKRTARSPRSSARIPSNPYQTVLPSPRNYLTPGSPKSRSTPYPGYSVPGPHPGIFPWPDTPPGGRGGKAGRRMFDTWLTEHEIFDLKMWGKPQKGAKPKKKR